MGYSILLFTLCCGSFYLGYLLSGYLSKRRDEKDKNEYVELVNFVYDTILNEIAETKFLNRINNTVTLSSNLDGCQIVVMYMIDKKDIAVFKDEKCVYTSDSVKPETVYQIIRSIESHHGDDINDVVNAMGFIFSREYFETNFKVKVSDIKKGLYDQKMSDIEKIKTANDTRLDINDVLDRILEVGVDKLTEEESEFLKDYNKKNPS